MLPNASPRRGSVARCVNLLGDVRQNGRWRGRVLRRLGGPSVDGATPRQRASRGVVGPRSRWSRMTPYTVVPTRSEWRAQAGRWSE